MALTTQEVWDVLQAAEARAESLGIKVSTSIVDARGDLVACVRMDGAKYFSTDVSRGKAMAAAMFGVASGELTERANRPVFQSLNLMYQGSLMYAQGAVPVLQEGGPDGAVGVSGGTAEQDEDVATAAVAALKR